MPRTWVCGWGYTTISGLFGHIHSLGLGTLELTDEHRSLRGIIVKIRIWNERREVIVLYAGCEFERGDPVSSKGLAGRQPGSVYLPTTTYAKLAFPRGLHWQIRSSNPNHRWQPFGYIDVIYCYWWLLTSTQRGDKRSVSVTQIRPWLTARLLA